MESSRTRRDEADIQSKWEGAEQFIRAMDELQSPMEIAELGIEFYWTMIIFFGNGNTGGMATGPNAWSGVVTKPPLEQYRQGEV